MYILKQLFFSISVNSGFINLFIPCSVYIQPGYSPRFQRIIVNCTLPTTQRTTAPPPPLPYLDSPLGSTRRSQVFFSTWVVEQNWAQSRLLNLFYDKEPLNSPNSPFSLSKRTSVVSIFYTLYHQARFFNKSECALYLNFIIEMQNKNVLITRTILRVDTTLGD